MASSSSSYMDIGGFGEDVLTDILSRLPVKSLLRFRCVNKFWYALIRSPDFITKHLQHNHTILIKGHAPLFCARDQIFEDFETNSRILKPILSGISCVNNTTNDETTTDVEVPSIDPDLYSHGTKNPKAFMMGPVNGIYCTNGLYLCNPSLREVKAIPKVPEDQSDDDNIEAILNSFGFGYDSKTNDYKVVRISFVMSWVNGNSCHAFLYSLRSNSWRKIECHLIKSLPKSPIEATFVSHGNGVSHWLLYDGDDENGFVILSFDFVNEVFRRSSLPEALDDKLRGYAVMVNDLPWLYRVYSIAVLNDESIALIIRLPAPLGDNGVSKKGHCWEVWVMKEYGVKESWTKLFATGFLPELSPFLGFANNNREILFLYVPDNHLVLYDPYRQQTKDLHMDAFGVRTYMESLVSIVNGGY